MPNKTLQQNVIDELSWDPMIDSEDIAVSAHADGTIMLRGTVGSFREKYEARQAAKRVYGVTNVNDQLNVRLLTGHRRQDAELRGDVLQALMLDAQVPDTIDATIKDGVVTLTGTAQWRYQRSEAEFVAGNVPGVVNIHNDVEIQNLVPEATYIHQSITKALERNARLDADNITVSSSHGHVTLTGGVHSWAERDAAVTAAWSAPGVTDVDDRLEIYH
jgi:osmotically-inducible protein OsmY